MKKSKKISLIVIASIIAIIFLVMFLTATLYSCTRKVDVLPTDFTPVRPSGDKVDFGSFDDLDLNDSIQRALEIYDFANELDQKVPNRLYYSHCESVSANPMGDVEVELFIHEFKNPDKYYETAYRLAKPGKTAPPDALNGIFEFQTAERTYHDSTLPSFAKYEKSLSPKLSSEKKPTADWRSAVKKDVAIPYYNKSQPIKYTKSEHTLTEETLTGVVLEKNDDGTISVTFFLDVNNDLTTINSRPTIQAGAKSDSAKFTDIIIKITVWDNGYYKEVNIVEEWTATLNIAGLANVNLKNNFEYMEKYTYNKELCNIDKLIEPKELLSEK